MVDAAAPLALACAYTEDDSGGIVSYRWNQSDGTLHEVARTPATATTYGAVHPAGTHVYTTNRVEGGVVTAYRIDGETGALTAVNRQSSEGAGPCFVSVDAIGRYAFVANYSAGTVAMLPIEEDGRLAPATEVVEHDGSSVDPERQGDRIRTPSYRDPRTSSSTSPISELTGSLSIASTSKTRRCDRPTPRTRRSTMEPGRGTSTFIRPNRTRT